MNRWLHENGSVISLLASALAVPLGSNTTVLTSGIGLAVALIGALGVIGSWAAYRSSKAREVYIDSQLDWTIQVTLANANSIAANGPQF
jgi:hypothetical protein